MLPEQWPSLWLPTFPDIEMVFSEKGNVWLWINFASVIWLCTLPNAVRGNWWFTLPVLQMFTIFNLFKYKILFLLQSWSKTYLNFENKRSLNHSAITCNSSTAVVLSVNYDWVTTAAKVDIVHSIRIHCSDQWQSSEFMEPACDNFTNYFCRRQHWIKHLSWDFIS